MESGMKPEVDAFNNNSEKTWLSSSVCVVEQSLWNTDANFVLSSFLSAFSPPVLRVAPSGWVMGRGRELGGWLFHVVSRPVFGI